MKKMFLLFVATALLCSAAYAQKPSEGGAFENFGVNMKAGLLNGVGLDFSTSLHPNIKARLGFNYLGFNAKNVIDGEDLEEGKIKFINADLLFDYYPVKNGVFHITAGTFIGSSKVMVAGSGFDEFSLNDYVIVPDENGYFKGTVKFGGAVKPYLGLGLGRTIPNRRVGFKFEMGVIYQGKFKVESDYLNPSMTSNDVEDTEKIPYLDSKFLPSITMSLVFRIK